jgi:glycosyltransferase involved in cell wall biosynthesis
MRVVQLIDSLNTGGAERIAVNYANSLVNKTSFSGLIASRKEGDLQSKINSNVGYLFLDRKKTLDLNAFKKFKKYLKNNKIDIIHAHGSSFFIAFLMKLRFPKIKIIYHEHNGERLKQSKKNNFLLLICSLFFERILTVNPEIEKWLKQNLWCKKVNYIPNFGFLDVEEKKITFLQKETSKKIVCLANLRYPKNHMALLKVFSEIRNKDWTLHLIGNDYHDAYSERLKEFVALNNLQEDVFIYGSRHDIYNILMQAEIGVLCSTYEGFPVSILEYGLCKLAVVSTDVGFCKEIIIDNKTGLLFTPNDEHLFKLKMKLMMDSESLRIQCAKNLNELVIENYSEDSVVNKLMTFYTS